MKNISVDFDIDILTKIIIQDLRRNFRNSEIIKKDEQEIKGLIASKSDALIREIKRDTLDFYKSGEGNVMQTISNYVNDKISERVNRYDEQRTKELKLHQEKKLYLKLKKKFEK